MGKQSRRKKERRKRGVGPVAGVARGVSQESLLALLEASSASPTACHRGASLALVFDSVMKRTRTGSQGASPDLLPILVEAANQEAADLWHLEDFLPCDARLEVVVRWEDGLYRILPSALEQPVAAIAVLRLLAEVIDPVLVGHLGFGLADAVELVLRRVDHVASVLAPAWGIRQETLGTRPVITSGEFAAARTLLDISEQARSCRNPQRAERALEALSVRPKRLGLNLVGRMSFFGPTIAVRMKPGLHVPIPAGILIQSIGELGGVLAEEAFRLDPGVERQWKDKIEQSLVRLLAGSGHLLTGPLDVAGAGTVYSAIPYSERQAVVLDVVPCLRVSSLLKAMAESTENLDRVALGNRMATELGDLPITADTQVLTLQVAAHPDKTPRGDNQTVTNFKDFMWMLRTAAQHPEDLWYFLRDLHNLRTNTDLSFVDLVDVWDMWRKSGKSFPLGFGTRPAVVVLPYGGEEQWEAAAESAPVERALFALGMVPVSSWPVFENLGDRAYIADRFVNVTYQVLPWEIPVAVTMTDSRDPSSDGDTVWYLGFGIVMKLDQMKDTFHAAAEAAGIKGLRIELVRDTEVSGAPVRILHRDSPVLVLGWNDQFAEAFLADPFGTEAVIGRALSEAFGSSKAKQTFIGGWDNTPLGVRLDATPFPEHGHHLSDADRSHPSQLAAVRQRLAEHTVASSVEQGTYVGEAAQKIETEVIYPWALDELHRVIEPYSAEGLLLMAFSQLERANHERVVHLLQLGWQRGMLSHDAELDPSRDRREEILQLAKAISLILEETLARPPIGNAPPDHLLWGEVLSVAEVVFASGFRSEMLRRNLARTEVTINDRFQIHIGDSSGPIDIDTSSYERQRALATLPQPVPINTPTDNAAVGSDDPKPLLEQMPGLAGVDEALREEKGFGLAALLGVLEVAWEWAITPQQPFAVTTTGDFADTAADQIPEVALEECKQAIEWLTLRAENLRAEEFQEYWETERRPTRIDTRPFVEYGSNLYVLPWTAMMTLVVVFNYLQDGRLPWPYQPPGDKTDTGTVYLGEGVKKALDRYRQDQNDQLEKEGYYLLCNTRLVTIRNVDPRKSKRVYGIDLPSGEIDLLSVDAERSRMWVVEVKDTFVPVSIRRARDAFHQFHDPNKHVDKLLGKVEDIKRQASTLARSLKVERPDRVWDVQGIMATRNVHPAAFAFQSPVPICTIEKVPDVILGSEIRQG